MKRELKVHKGQKFYDLTVLDDTIQFKIEPSGKKKRSVLCKCKCGKIKLIPLGNLYDKRETSRSKSCGCTKRFVNGINAQSRRKPESVYRYIYEQYQTGAKTRKINFNLSKEEYVEIVKKDCFYCGEPAPTKQPHRGKNNYVGVPVPYNGIDRIDSNMGYEKENCVPCCTKCNYMKSDMDVSSFTEHILKITNHLQKSIWQEEIAKKINQLVLV
jgi:hypothetical protein